MKLNYGDLVVDPAGVHWIIWEQKPDGLALVYELSDDGSHNTSRIAIIPTHNLTTGSQKALDQIINKTPRVTIFDRKLP